MEQQICDLIQEHIELVKETDETNHELMKKHLIFALERIRSMARHLQEVEGLTNELSEGFNTLSDAYLNKRQ